MKKRPHYLAVVVTCSGACNTKLQDQTSSPSPLESGRPQSGSRHLCMMTRSSLFGILHGELVYGVSIAVWHTQAAGFRD